MIPLGANPLGGFVLYWPLSGIGSAGTVLLSIMWGVDHPGIPPIQFWLACMKIQLVSCGMSLLNLMLVRRNEGSGSAAIPPPPAS